jgi:trans-aconitate methyltransferase
MIGEKMDNKSNFYKKSQMFNRPSALLRGFFNMKLNEELKDKKAIDFGCGVGNDTQFLIENGFFVTCVDKNSRSKEFVYEKLQNSDRYDFLNEEFKDVKLPKVDLFYSCLSLQFINPMDIDSVMKKINDSINKRGFFVR